MSGAVPLLVVVRPGAPRPPGTSLVTQVARPRLRHHVPEGLPDGVAVGVGPPQSRRDVVPPAGRGPHSLGSWAQPPPLLGPHSLRPVGPYSSPLRGPHPPLRSVGPTPPPLRGPHRPRSVGPTLLRSVGPTSPPRDSTPAPPAPTATRGWVAWGESRRGCRCGGSSASCERRGSCSCRCRGS